MGMITFDTVTLRIPLEELNSFNDEKFVQGKGSTLTTTKQDTPIGFSPLVVSDGTLIVQHSAKALHDNYKDGINITNFYDVFDRIRHITTIDKSVLANSKPYRIDVNNNIDITDFGLSKQEILNIVAAHHTNTNYTLSHYDKTDNSGIVLTLKAKTTNNRVSLYDKEKDLKKKANTHFIESLSNPNKLISDFQNIIRVETNVRTKKCIVEKLNVKGEYNYLSCLQSTENVNANNLLKICTKKDIYNLYDIELYSHYCKCNPIEIKGLLSTFCEYNYDVNLVKSYLKHLNKWTRQNLYDNWSNKNGKNIEGLFLFAKAQRNKTDYRTSNEIFSKFIELLKIAA